MVRPFKSRFVGCMPGVMAFKPRGVPLGCLEAVEIGLDELEALRLADREGLHHEEAAEKMRVSRATFGRIIEGARRKVADAIVSGKAILIRSPEAEAERGLVSFPPGRRGRGRRLRRRGGRGAGGSGA